MKKLVQARMLSVRKGRYSSSASPFRWLAFAVAVTNAKADMWNCFLDRWLLQDHHVSRAATFAIAGLLPCCCWTHSKHYSSAPHHRRFEMSITNSSGALDLCRWWWEGLSPPVVEPAVMGGASPPVRKPLFRTGGDDLFPIKKIYLYIN